MQFVTPLLPLHEMLTSMWDENNYMCFLQPHSTPVLTKDGIRTLTNIVIVDPKRTNLLFKFCVIQGFVASNVTQANEKNYRNRHPIDQFLPLATKVFSCLHRHADVFLYDCANAIWSLKRPESLHIFTLVTFLCQKISITLRRMQAYSILSQAIVVGLAISPLPPLQDTPPITTINLLQGVDF